jgi:hypothetical protein
MDFGTSRRQFLTTTGTVASLGFSRLEPALSGPSLAVQADQSAQPNGRPKIAAIATTYYYLSHAYHIVGRFLDGFMIFEPGGKRVHHQPPFEVASLFIEQIQDDTDLGRAKAARHQVRLSPTIADALTLGTETLAVDAVLLIAEHGDYPLNDRLQKLYPRGRFFREILEVFKSSRRSVPVFIDKHLSYSRHEAQEMVDQARSRGVPLMAGSSLPVTWRLPPLEIPLGQPIRDILVASRGNLEIFGFHALETLQCMAERRDRRGRPQGVKAVTCLEGEAVWNAADEGIWSWELLDRALSRSHTVNPGDIKQNTRDFTPPPIRDVATMARVPTAFVVEYQDGLRATALLLNGHVDDTTVAVKTVDQTGRESILSTLVYLPAPPGARFFDPLVLRIEEFFQSKSPPYPVDRTLLSGGILDAALQSRVENHRRIETPELAMIDYEAPADSGFIRLPLTDPTSNRLLQADETTEVDTPQGD